MGTAVIPLGSAGSDPNEVGKSTSIPIPESLPVDPTVLVDGYVPSTDNDLPRGGLKDSVLKKKSGVDYDTYWGEDETYAIPEDTVITRDANDLIETIVTASKTTTITRDIDGNITSTEDGEYKKDIVRTNGLISAINVTKL